MVRFDRTSDPATKVIMETSAPDTGVPERSVTDPNAVQGFGKSRTA
jgi:hypothetical protein